MPNEKEYTDQPLPDGAGRNLAIDLLAGIAPPPAATQEGAQPGSGAAAPTQPEAPVQPAVTPRQETLRELQNRFKPKAEPITVTDGPAAEFEPQLKNVDDALVSTEALEAEMSQQGGAHNPEVSRAFAKLRHELSSVRKTIIPGYTKKLEEAQAKLDEETRKLNELNARVEQAEREKVELTEKLGKVSLRESPEFQRKYGERELSIVSRLGTSISRALGLAPEEGLKTARDLLQNSDDPVALNEATKGMDPTIAGMVHIVAADLAAMNQERQSEIDNWRQANTASVLEAGRKEAEGAIAERIKSAEMGIEHLKTSGHAALEILTENEQQEVFDGYKGWLRQAPVDEIFKAAVEGYVAPVLQGKITELQEELAAKDKEVAAIKHAYGVPVTSRTPQQAPVPKPVAPVTPPAKPVSQHDLALSILPGFNPQ